MYGDTIEDRAENHRALVRKILDEPKWGEEEQVIPESKPDIEQIDERSPREDKRVVVGGIPFELVNWHPIWYDDCLGNHTRGRAVLWNRSSTIYDFMRYLRAETPELAP